MKNLRIIAAIGLALGAIVLGGCGGGGGGATGSGTASTTTSGTTTGSSGTTGASATTSSGSVTVQLYNGGAPVTAAAPNTTGMTAKATLLDESGAPVTNTTVTFASSSTDLVLTPTTAVTDGTGVASVNVSSAAQTVGGAVSLTATASVNGKSVSNSSAPKVVTVAAARPTITLTVMTGGGTAPGSGTCPNNAATSSVDTVSAVVVCATVKDAAGVDAQNAIVSFAADGAYLSMTPSTGTRSTGTTGKASISVIGTASTPGGATQVTAQALLADGVTSVTAVPVTLSVTGLAANATPMPSLDLKACVTAPCTVGNASTSLAIGAPLTIQATLKDGNSAAIPNTVIAFTSADTTLASVSQATALTDAAGVATIRLDAASVSAAGANYVNATATTGGKTVTASTPFQVGAAAVTIKLKLNSASISAYGTTSVVAYVTVNNAAPTTPITVQFTSGCASSGKASLQTGVQTANGVDPDDGLTKGVATATYTDMACAQKDTIVASVNSVQKSADLDVSAPAVANIQFSGTTPTTGLLVLRGTGGIGYSETSVVQFKVVDTAGVGMANKSVDFGLTTGLGGITLDGIAYQAGTMKTKQTDASGNVSVTVQSGTAPTAVWVTATLNGSTLSTQSNKLIISTGRPAQDFFSLAASKLNIEGGNYDGAQTILTVRAADRLGNAVPDGTVINFITEGAHIISSSNSTCSTASGSCSVTLESAAYRPTSDTEPNNLVTRNRVTVVAYTLGEESFIDANGNNLYDAGETYTDLGDVFIDNNENQTWNVNEQFISFSSANVSACADVIATSPYAPSKSGSCDGKWGQAHVRRDVVIVLSGDTAKIGNGAAANRTLDMGTSCTKTFTINLRDQYDNPMAVGTALAIVDAHVTDVSATPYAATVSVSPSTVQNTNASGGTYHTVTISANNGTCVHPVSGTFNLNATTPTTGTTTTLPFTVNGS